MTTIEEWLNLLLELLSDPESFAGRASEHVPPKPDDGGTIDALSLGIAAIALVISGLSAFFTWQSKTIGRSQFERSIENVQILPELQVKGQTLVLYNGSDDPAFDVSLVVRTEYGRGYKKIAEKLVRGSPVEVPLRSLFNTSVTFGAPPRNHEEGMREIDVHIRYKSEKHNLFHGSAKVRMYMGAGSYGTSHQSADGEFISFAMSERWEL